MYPRQERQIKLFLLFADFLSLLAAIAVALFLQEKIIDEIIFSRPSTINAIQKIVVYYYVIIWIVALQQRNLYRSMYGRIDEFMALVKTGFVVLLIFSLLAFIFKVYIFAGSRIFWFVLWTASVMFIFINRRICYAIIKKIIKAKSIRKRVLIYGFDELGKDIYRRMTEQESYYEVIGFLDEFEKESFLKNNKMYLGSIGQLEQFSKELQIDEVLIALPYGGREKMLEIIAACDYLHINWKIAPDSLGVKLKNVGFYEIGEMPFLGPKASELEGINLYLKTCLDRIVSLAALIVLSPVIALVAMAIRMNSPGPVFFNQTRVGRKGKNFTMHKFRTMTTDSAEDLHKKYVSEYIEGRENSAETDDEIKKLKNDTRITRVGRLLRALSLDEIPQFFNVLKGEMSVVGPRPAILYEIEKYSQWQRRRLNIRPGITGLWQVEGRNRLTFDDGVKLDLQYIDNWSYELDIKIMLKTLWVVFFRRER